MKKRLDLFLVPKTITLLSVRALIPGKKIKFLNQMDIYFLTVPVTSFIKLTGKSVHCMRLVKVTFTK